MAASTHDGRMLGPMPMPPVNVGQQERVFSGVSGGALALWGLRRIGSPQGLLALATGGGLLFRAFSGHCAMYQALGMNTCSKCESQDKSEYNDVDESSEDSFPASDPPSYTSTAASRNHAG